MSKEPTKNATVNTKDLQQEKPNATKFSKNFEIEETLTEKLLLEISTEQNKLIAQNKNFEIELSAKSEELKPQIKGNEKRIDELSQQFNKKKRIRTHTLTPEMDFKKSVMIFRNPFTKAVIEEVKMTDKQKQIEMPIKETKEVKK